MIEPARRLVCGALLAILLAACQLVEPPEAPAAVILLEAPTFGAEVGHHLPVTLRVEDADGRPVGGVDVFWELVDAAGAIYRFGRTTDGNGVASALWNAGERSGEGRLRIEVPGRPSLAYRFEISPGPAAVLALTPERARIPGVGVSTDLEARAEDRFGNPVPAVLSWRSSDPSVVRVANGHVTSVGRGEASVSVSAGSLAASATIVVAAGG